MNKKLRLKEMSHKKLRKLCKGLGRQCADYSKENGMLLNSEAKKAEEIGELKRYATSLEKTLASESHRIKDKDKRIAELEHALDAMGNGMTMGVDGQLRSFNELTDEQHAAWVEKEIARAKEEEDEEIVLDWIPEKPTGVAESESQRVDMVGSIFGVPQGNGEIKSTELNTEPADVDAAVEWAKRNGHHQPEGNPEPNKSESVRIKSADEISEENKQKHVDIVCNEIQKDASRILNATDYIDSGHTDKM